MRKLKNDAELSLNICNFKLFANLIQLFIL